MKNHRCIKYRGPDTKYNGRDICYGYNEDTLTIYDATNKVGKTGKASSIISRTTYEGASYTHQGQVCDILSELSGFDKTDNVTGDRSHVARVCSHERRVR